MAVAVVAGLSAVGGQAITVGLAQFTLAMATKAFVLGAGLSMISRALQPKLEVGQDTGLTTSVSNPIAERPIIYGRTRTGGTIVYFTTSGSDSKFLHLVIAVAGHAIDGYEKVYFDDQVIWEDGSYVDDWVQNAQINFFDGTQTTADQDLINASNEWNSNCILNDTAYIHVRLEYDPEVYTNGIPSITTTIRGKKVYDPRTDVTEWSENPALCIYDYLQDPKYGLNDDTVNLAQVIASANVCDQLVTIDTDVDQTRYALSGFINSGDTVKANIEKMLSSMFGRLVCTGGELFINAGYYTSPVLDIDESMLVGEVSLQTKTSRRNTYNAVKGTFLSEEENYIFADYPSIKSDTYSVEDGEPLYLDLPLPCTTNNVRAQRLAKLSLNKSRQQRTLSIPVNLAGLKVRAGDVIRFTSERLGISNAEYEVIDFEFEYSDQLIVNLVCVETGASLYDWTVSDKLDFSASSDITLYDGSAKAPTGLSATAVTEILDDGTSSIYIDVAWTNPDDIYFDYTTLKYGNQSIVTKDQTYRINNVGLDEYTITVTATNVYGRQSSQLSVDVTTAPDTVAPSVPTSMAISGGFNKIELSWTNPTDNDFDLIDIKVNTSNDEPNATPLASLRASKFTHNLGSNETRFYWLRALDRTGNASAWVYAGTDTTSQLQSGDFDTTTQNILTSVADYDTDISNINTSITNLDTDITAVEADVATRALESDLQNITQELDDNLTTASERLLSMSLFASEQAGIMRDAGITVDPDNGSVTIQAVEELRTETDSQFTQVGLEIDAVDAQLNLYATRTFVENEIAQAQLDPTDFTAFTDLQARVNQAEIDIDANTASVVLKADQTTLDSLDVRVAQAEIDIDGAEANIALKANQSDFDSLNTRVTSAEIEIDAIDVASITQTVADVNNLTHRVNDAEVQDIKQLLEIYESRQTLQQDIAFARTQITADVTDVRESIATQRTELGALIDGNASSIIAEQTARANADSAITEDITQLQADLTSAEGDISGNATAITSLDGRVTTAEGSITSQATDITNLESSVTDLETDTTNNATAISSLDTRVTSAEGDITSQSTSITQLQADLTTAQNDITGNTTDITSNSTAITNLDTRVTSAEGTITSQATDITNLGSSITDLETDTSNNATAISGLDTRVTQTETDITTQSTSITNLETSINEKIITFSQDDEPTEGLTEGDLWIDTDDNNRLYRYNGTEWLEVADNRIADTATALSQLTTAVTELSGGEITAITQDITQLQTDVAGNTAEIISVAETASSETSASAKRLEQLVTGQAETQLVEILNRENNQDNLNSEIAVVRSDFNAVTNENRESIAQTRTDLVALIDGNSADITSESLARASADEALTSQINSLRTDLTSAEGDIQGNADATTLLTTRVTDNEGDITSISADVTTLQASVTNAENNITANGTAITALDTRVTQTETDITSQASDITELESTVTGIQTDITGIQTDVTGNATAITGLDTRVTATETSITSQASDITTLQSDVTGLTTDTTSNATSITGLDTRVTANETSITSQATAVTNLTTTVGTNTSSISENLSSINGIKAQYSVTLNTNGTVSGFGLISDIIDENPTSSFNVSADQFSIVSPTDGELWVDTSDYLEDDIVYYLGKTYQALRDNSNKQPDTNPQDWEDVTSTPFVVYSTDTDVVRDGDTITIPAGTYIKDAFISNLSASQIKTGTLEADRLKIDNVTLDTNASGQLIISENGVDTTQIANGAVNTDQVELEAVNKLADAYTAGGEFILSNVTETVQTISITTTGSPVQILASGVGSLASGNFAYVSFGIYRDDTIVRTMNNLSMATNNNRSETIVLRDTPPAGTHTYTLRATASLQNIYVSARYLSAQEVKR